MSARADIASVRPIIGMEVHVELSTRTKLFTAAPNPAAAGAMHDDARPNTLIDPVVLALPGSLPVLNRRAVELSMLVGMGLGCSIAQRSVWDRKSYFYADLPKAYQISQYELPICFDGSVDVPTLAPDGTSWDLDAPSDRIGIVRAHLEEDAGKLLHEAPGGRAIDGSIVDLNRAGTPLLEIVTAPDFTSAESCVSFARLLRGLCRFLRASEGVLQRGHMRFEPNINCELTLDDGRLVRTPIVEVKNLNSYRALRGAIEHELREQPGRWVADGREAGAGTKSTRGWDDANLRTIPQREKEDAHDYRYFPDPDLPAVRVSDAWRERVRRELVEAPVERARRYASGLGIAGKDAQTLVAERAQAELFEDSIDEAVARGAERAPAARLAANLILQVGAKLANREADPGASAADRTLADLGITPAQLGGVVALRAAGSISSNGADELVERLCDEAGADAERLAEREGLLVVRDAGQLDAWCAETIEA
ncbi:MAG: Asp-tRNA(Asn)/Glu-tRNA(Gln) amidotransferase subunit GatB, partial [Planctomycetota bacterium]